MTQTRQTGIAVVLLALVFAGVAACSGAAVSTIPAPTSAAQQPTEGLSSAALTATASCLVGTQQSSVMIWKIFGTPTPNPGQPTATPQPIPTTEPGDPERGKQIFNTTGQCHTCHNVDNDEVFVGPPLRAVARWAPYRRPDMSAGEYLFRVILDPNAFMVTGNKMRVMPQTFGQKLTTQEISDVVAYLLTLDGTQTQG